MTITELWDDPVKLLKWYADVDLGPLEPDQVEAVFRQRTGVDPDEYRDGVRLVLQAAGANRLLPKRQTHKQFVLECASVGLGIKKGTVAERQLAARALYPERYGPVEGTNP